MKGLWHILVLDRCTLESMDMNSLKQILLITNMTNCYGHWVVLDGSINCQPYRRKSAPHTSFRSARFITTKHSLNFDQLPDYGFPMIRAIVYWVMMNKGITSNRSLKNNHSFAEWCHALMGKSKSILQSLKKLKEALPRNLVGYIPLPCPASMTSEPPFVAWKFVYKEKSLSPLKFVVLSYHQVTTFDKLLLKKPQTNTYLYHYHIPTMASTRPKVLVVLTNHSSFQLNGETKQTGWYLVRFKHPGRGYSKL